jgi:hypothetical protein
VSVVIVILCLAFSFVWMLAGGAKSTVASER